MDINIEVRKKQLNSLDQLIQSARDRLLEILNALGWSEDSLKTQELQMVKCPLNRTHKVTPKRLQNHIDQCVLNYEGYTNKLDDSSTKKIQFLSECSDNNIHSKRTIYLDQTKKIEILTKAYTEVPNFHLAWNGRDPDPKTADRFTATFSSDERLALYNYVVANTQTPTPPPEFSTYFNAKKDATSDDALQLSFEEQLGRERDAKRRRTKYRAVHVNRKNHTEVIREVINGQMEDLKEWFTVKNRKKNGGLSDAKDVAGNSGSREKKVIRNRRISRYRNEYRDIRNDRRSRHWRHNHRSSSSSRNRRRDRRRSYSRSSASSTSSHLSRHRSRSRSPDRNNRRKRS